ncbi:MAG TPA: hypothetical protein VIQ31_32850 [Phormidium sp.]
MPEKKLLGLELPADVAEMLSDSQQIEIQKIYRQLHELPTESAALLGTAMIAQAWAGRNLALQLAASMDANAMKLP